MADGAALIGPTVVNGFVLVLVDGALLIDLTVVNGFVLVLVGGALLIDLTVVNICLTHFANAFVG